MASGSDYIDLPASEEISDAPAIAARPAAAEPIALPGDPKGREPVAITRIAHASVLVDFGGRCVLTDPWFTETPEYHQGEPLGVAPDRLPPLTAVVASHAHYDHYDVENFARHVPLDVPLLVGAFDDMAGRARAAGFTDVREVSAGDRQSIDGVEITALPGAHNVAELTYLLSAGQTTVYFAADTLVTPEVRRIAERGPIDVALLPVNGLRVGGDPAVSTPEESALFAGLLGAKVAIPIHYRFYGGPKTDEHLLAYNGNPARFLNSLARLAPEALGRILEPGQLQTIA